MTNEEIEEMYEQEMFEQKEKINSTYNVRNYHYTPSGHVPEEYQEVYYQLQDLEQEVTKLLNQTTDKSIILKINDKKSEISSYLNDISEFGLYNDLNMFFSQDINKIPLELKKGIQEIKELIDCGN